MLTSARQVVDDSCRDPELQEGRNSLSFSSTVCAAPQEELTEVKDENLQPPDETLMVAEFTTSDSDSSPLDSSGEVEGVTASLADFNRQVVPHRLHLRMCKRPCTSTRDLAPSISVIKFQGQAGVWSPLHQGFVRVGQDDGIERPLCKGCFGQER
jgi:hypothetical protein